MFSDDVDPHDFIETLAEVPPASAKKSEARKCLWRRGQGEQRSRKSAAQHCRPRRSMRWAKRHPAALGGRCGEFLRWAGVGGSRRGEWASAIIEPSYRLARYLNNPSPPGPALKRYEWSMFLRSDPLCWTLPSALRQVMNWPPFSRNGPSPD